ncbi:MAG: hypothetical protein AB7F19_00635 [Candidatus Babeliales bacterium]
MYIKFNKLSENDTTVTYLLETEILDESSKSINHIFVKAIGIFDKETETLIYDENNTDPYYLKKHREYFHVLYYLRKFHRSGNSFPQVYNIITS